MFIGPAEFNEADTYRRLKAGIHKAAREAENARRKAEKDRLASERLSRQAAIMTLAEPFQDEAVQPPKLAHILATVATVTETSVMDLKSPRRHMNVSRSRFVFYAVARRLTKASLPMIGKAVGGKDHSTVLNGLGRVKEHPELYEPIIQRVYEMLNVWPCQEI